MAIHFAGGDAGEREGNTGISPLRRAIRLRGFGRDDVDFGELEFFGQDDNFGMVRASGRDRAGA